MSAELRMVAVFRGDITMPLGKWTAQAGHAFLGCWRHASKIQPELAEQYDHSAQPKICLLGGDVDALQRLFDRATGRGVPCVLITDAAKTVFAEPTVTVLGLGPMTKTDSNALTRGLKLL